MFTKKYKVVLYVVSNNVFLNKIYEGIREMSVEKLYEKIKSNSNNISFEEIDKLLQAGGFKRRPCKSSHNVYTHPELHDIRDSITIPYKRPIRSFYIKEALKRFELANPEFVGKE